LHSFAKAIFFKPEGVWGKPITRQMAPKLWEDVDEASRFLGAKKCDGVLVDYELNAAAVQFHRWGLVGPITNYVVLGIPLMDSMGREHIRSTLAHEIAHLQLKHGTKARRWFAMLEMYQSLRKNLEGGWLWFVFKPFVLWYVPRLHAMLQPVSLQSEFEADAAESRFTSKLAASQSLCYLAISSDVLCKAIRDFCRSVAQGSAPTGSDLADAVHSALRGWTWQEAESKISEALLRKTDIEGSHPALSERLEALGGEPTQVEPVAVSASEEYFGEQRMTLAAEVAQAYVDSEECVNLISAFKEALEVDESLADKVTQGEASVDEALDYIYLVGMDKGHGHVMPAINMYSHRYADNPGLQYFKGMALLKDGDDEGLRALERVVELEPSRAAEIYEIVYQFLLAKGRAEEAAAFRARRDEFTDVVRSVYQDRLKLPKDVQYEAHDFTEGEIRGIGSVLVQVKSIDCAYLVKRIDKAAPITIYDLYFTMKKYRVTYDGNALTQEIEEALAPLDRYIAVFFGPWLEKGVKSRIKQTPGSLIYQREAYLAKLKVESHSDAS
jgi:tetratricopeptide (TPR) repeat protein